ncbi:phosphate ABC transporter permease subunit PstC [Candidatus Sumerlaeota bacterium]|nr:phosphate ABC transporter permease subunit PstC [Candidatus Sumerlaeota bacterium]
MAARGLRESAEFRATSAALRARLRRPVSLFFRLKERVIEWFLLACGMLSAIAVALIFFFLFKEGIVALRMVPLSQFISTLSDVTKYDPVEDVTTVVGQQRDFIWQPVSETPKFSVVPLMWGSFGIALISAFISTLCGVGIGIYLSEIATRRTRDIIKPMLEVLVGIPTVVIGFFMLAVIAEPIRALASGGVFSWLHIPFYNRSLNMFVGALGVSFVIIPVIASLVDDALRAVPNDLRAASLAVGATRWQTTWRVTLPAAVSGVFAALILGFGRALGETMIVMMCAGNAPVIHLNPFEPVRTMTASIASEMGAAQYGGLHAHVLFLVGALLVTMTFLLNVVVEIVINKYRKRIRL